MTDNEIIKALKCCQTNKCDECPIYKECHATEKGRVNVVLDLINCLNEKDKKNEGIIELADKTIKAQSAEIERLKSEIVVRDRIIDERGKEIIRHDNAIRSLHKQLDYLKSEAIKEFAERLKERVKSAWAKHFCVFPPPQNSDISQKYLKLEDFDKHINNLVKEMVGDDNA